MKLLSAVVLLFGVGCRGDGDPPADPPDASGEADADPSTWPDGTPHPAGEVWVQTWNIERFPKTAVAPARVADILTQVNAEIVAIQEIRDVPAFVALDELLPQYERILPVDDPGSDDTIVGLLYQPGLVTMTEIETLFPGDWWAFPRLPIKARASIGTIDFTIVVLHLKASGDTESKDRRREAIGKLDTWIRAELAEGVERDVLVVGDWNDELTDPLADNVFQVLLDDPATYRFLTMPMAQAGEFTFIPFESMLDHAMITSDLETELGTGAADILELELGDSSYDDDVSDHRPVLVKLKP